MVTWQPGDLILDYTLLKRLGSGGFGEVWEAQKASGNLTRSYALKILDPRGTDARQFRAETLLWAEATELPHANIVALHYAGSYKPTPNGDTYFILVSDLCPDGTLMQWLEQYDDKKAPTWERAVELALGILQGLTYLHERRKPILHRDMKPQNILMRGDVPLLADFGVASVQEVSAQFTSTSGTLAWMPPEALDVEDGADQALAAAERLSSPQWDIWSVGVILYQLLTGRLPFPQRGLSLLRAIAELPPQPFPDNIPAPLQAIVLRALEKDRKQRWQSASAMRSALEKARDTIHDAQRQAELDAAEAKGKRATEEALRKAEADKQKLKEQEEKARQEAERLRHRKGNPINLPAVISIVALGAIGGPVVFVNYQHYRAEQKEEAKRQQEAERQAELKRQAEAAKKARYDKGIKAYKEDNYDEAFRLLKPFADGGDRDSCFRIAYMYDVGKGIKQNYPQALRLYKKAIDKGESSAMVNLGIMYENSHGVTKDYSEALKWYRKAAEAGEGAGMTCLGDMYRDGEGVTKDYSEAVKWYRKAAEAGQGAGMTSFGNCYYYGRGVTKDYSEAVKWYRKATEAGESMGMNNLGAMYADGEGVTKDYSEAVKWYRKAAEAGEVLGMTNLGVMYQNGSGVTKDLEMAKNWYRKAAKAGNETAKENLKRLGEKV